MKPTRADREAFAREYWDGVVARGTRGDVWIETGRGGNPAWDAGARAVARLSNEHLGKVARIGRDGVGAMSWKIRELERELAEVNERLSAERLARQEASADTVIARAELGGARYELQRMADGSSRQRAELLRLAAAVAVKVGEHEYARAVADEQRKAERQARFLAKLSARGEPRW